VAYRILSGSWRIRPASGYNEKPMAGLAKWLYNENYQNTINMAIHHRSLINEVKMWLCGENNQPSKMKYMKSNGISEITSAGINR
jgi:hypothetical protein